MLQAITGHGERMNAESPTGSKLPPVPSDDLPEQRVKPPMHPDAAAFYSAKEAGIEWKPNVPGGTDSLSPFEEFLARLGTRLP